MSRSQGHVGTRGDELPIRVFCTMIRPNPYRGSADSPYSIVGAVCDSSNRQPGEPAEFPTNVKGVGAKVASVYVLLAGRQGLLPRVGDEHLQ
jgi:hypothetical protein